MDLRAMLCVGTLACASMLRAETSEPAKLDAVQSLTVEKLRTYCRSCHAVGALRFIHSEDDAEVWTYITETRVPGSQTLWREAIFAVLDWPQDAPPPFDELKDPAAGRDWMPKGVKRLQLADDYVDSRSVRAVMLEALSATD